MRTSISVATPTLRPRSLRMYRTTADRVLTLTDALRVLIGFICKAPGVRGSDQPGTPAHLAVRIFLSVSLAVDGHHVLRGGHARRAEAPAHVQHPARRATHHSPPGGLLPLLLHLAGLPVDPLAVGHQDRHS